MAFALFLLLAASVFVPGASRELVCVIADAGQGAVRTVGLDPLSIGLIAGRCLMDKPMLDVCYSAGSIYIAGPTSTLPSAAPIKGGHITRVGVTCEPEVVAQFDEPCTAIACANDRLVFALEGVGVKSIKYDGSHEQDVRLLPNSFIRNIFLDISTHTAVFVDITTHVIYVTDYTANFTSDLAAAGASSEGAVGATVDYECPITREPTQLWGYDSFLVVSLQPTEGGGATDVSSKPKLVVGKNSDNEYQLEFTFDIPAEVYTVSTDYRFNKQIHLELFNKFDDGVFSETKENKDPDRWRTVTWTTPSDIGFTKAVISFGTFEPSNEVKLRNYIFEVCSEAGFRRRRAVSELAESEESVRLNRTAYINVVYEDCRVERCLLVGDTLGFASFTDCQVIREPSGSQSCLPVSGTTDRVIIHDDRNRLISVNPYKFPSQETTTISSAEDIVGMDCFTRFYDPRDDLCESDTCLNGGACVVTLAGYQCFCSTGYRGRNCETPCTNCFGFSTSHLSFVRDIFGRPSGPPENFNFTNSD